MYNSSVRRYFRKNSLSGVREPRTCMSECVLKTLACRGLRVGPSQVSSGHLPLMMPILLLVFLVDGLVARVAWAVGHLKAASTTNVGSLDHPPTGSSIPPFSTANAGPPTPLLGPKNTDFGLLFLRKYRKTARNLLNKRSLVVLGSWFLLCFS